MAKLLRLDEVAVYTRNQKLAKEFYTRKLGLKVRNSMPSFGYLALGTTKGGADASLGVWQPDPKWGQAVYEAGVSQIGSVSGIGFSTGDLARTVEQLSRRGVKIETESEGFARLRDPDGNVLFVAEADRPKVRRAGLLKVEFQTVVTRDEAKVGAFFTKALGMKRRTERGEERSFTSYRLAPDQTSIMPFAPTREMYDNPGDYDADMAHVGENTGIGFLVDDPFKVQDRLLAKGVEFAEPVKKQDWGGISGRIYDPDRNRYMIYKMGR